MFIRASIAILCVLVCITFILSGCTPNKDPSPTREQSAESKPFMFVYRTPNHPAPNAPIEAGVVVAVWDDGTIVRACSGHPIGKKYIKGKITADHVAELRQYITASGLPSQNPESHLGVDATAIHLTLRANGTLQTWSYSPGHQTNAEIEAIQSFALDVEVADVTDASAETYGSYPHAWYE